MANVIQSTRRTTVQGAGAAIAAVVLLGGPELGFFSEADGVGEFLAGGFRFSRLMA